MTWPTTGHTEPHTHGHLNRARPRPPEPMSLLSTQAWIFVFIGVFRLFLPKNGCGITHLTQPSDGSGISDEERLFFFGHEDTQIIHFHMGRHEASRQKKMWKIPTNLWMISPSPRKSELEKSDITTPLVSSRTFRSVSSNPSSTSRCHLLACVEDTLRNSWRIIEFCARWTWATKKTLPQSLFFWLVHRMFLSTLILKNTGSILGCPRKLVNG